MAANVGRIDIFQRQATRFKAVVVTGQTIPVDYGILRQASLANLARSAVECLTFGYPNREQEYRSQDCETNTESVPTGHSCLQNVDFDLWLFYTRRNTVATVLRILVLVTVFFNKGITLLAPNPARIFSVFRTAFLRKIRHYRPLVSERFRENNLASPT